MANHWIIIAKIAGPLSIQMRKELLKWTAAGPADGEQPQWINGDLFLVKNKEEINKMQKFAAHLEGNAHMPPVLFFQRFIDSWTVAPLLHLYDSLRGKDIYLRLARSEVLDYLFIDPKDWDRLNSTVQVIQQKVYAKDFLSFETRLLYTQLALCGEAWENLLSASCINRAIVIISQAIGLSWTDDDVIQGCIEMPSWYL